MTNADLIAEARLRDERGLVPIAALVSRLADALEASEAQVARLAQEVAYLKAKAEMDGGPNCSMCRKDGPEGPHDRHDGRPCSYHDGTCAEAEANPALKCQCGRFVPMAGASWPADLLEAVQRLTDNTDRVVCVDGKCGEARAVLGCYGLLKEAR